MSIVVIVIMGEVESGNNSVGRLLADSLGWEFADVACQSCTQTRDGRAGAEKIPNWEALCAAIVSSDCEWRDVIVSCPSLTEEDQRRLRHDHPLANFVYLKGPDREARPPVTLMDQPVELVNSGTPVRRSAALEYDESVLSVDSSRGVDQILSAVLSALILKPRSPNVRVA